MINNKGILVADVSSYQVNPYHAESSINSLAERLYHCGVRGLMIKLTQGTNYENAYAAAQYRAWATVMHNHGHEDPKVGFYNYCTYSNGKANANYFIAWLKAFGMSKDTAVALDFEDPTVGGNYEINEWLKTMKDAGYVNRSVYSMASWFGERISSVAIQCNNFWVAAYSSSAPALVGSKYYRTAWQFSDDYRGMNVDMSLDYGHILAPDIPRSSHKKVTAKPKKSEKPTKKDNKKAEPKHTAKKPEEKKSAPKKPKVSKPASPKYAKESGIYQNTLEMNIYDDVHLNHRVGTLPAHSMVNALPVEDNGATRLLLKPYGVYISANLRWIHLLHKE